MLSKRVAWLCLMVVACIASVQGQTVIAFQGAEPGDTWAYTASGASSIALAEAQSAANYTDGTQSIVMGGLSGGGSCLSSGSGDGVSVPKNPTGRKYKIINFNPVYEKVKIYRESDHKGSQGV